MHTFMIEQEHGTRVPFTGTLAEGIARTREIAIAWGTRATLIEPTTGRTIVSVECDEHGALPRVACAAA